jgi:hypothetical protein
MSKSAITRLGKNVVWTGTYPKRGPNLSIESPWFGQTAMKARALIPKFVNYRGDR